ncbi:cell division protein FtsL [Hylemonella gracilis str. Niagara R]|uniref:Cell division protein FtsL n=1 Tax=Hylemonella gracilis str. Niagara R TaxID=1458275 RepID=A0A016XEQ0_9BURK|nr:cell division protein FtsL [Hylemonella gracilis]EYC50400.1 cell division protein FtsL [Hylemonella gracilis str. Niagara R]
MTRVNFMLFLAVMVSALYLVHVQYESRRLFAALDRAMLDAHRIDTEREQLELEKRRQAGAQRVEQLARDRLQMRTATPAITDYVTLGRNGSVAMVEAGAAREVQGRLSGVNLPRGLVNPDGGDTAREGR